MAVGCGKDAASSSSSQSSASPFVFAGESVWDAASTRGKVIEDFVEGDSIGVYAYNIPTSGEFTIDDLSPNFMFNQALIKQNDDSWFYTPVKYWPDSDKYDMYFFGYAPHSVDQYYTKYDSSEDGFPIIEHESPLSLFDSRDLVMAGRKCVEKVETVELDFEHMLARVKFEFRNTMIENADNPYTMVVRSISLINATTRSAFTFQEDATSSTGLLIVNYKEDEVWGTGTIVASIETGGLIGGIDFDGDGVPDLFGKDNYVLGSDGNYDSDSKPDIRYDENNNIVFGEFDKSSGEVVLNDCNVFGSSVYPSGVTGYHIDDPSTIYTIPAIVKTEDCFLEPVSATDNDNFTDITAPDHYLFFDPYIVKKVDGSGEDAVSVILDVEVELYVESINDGYAEKSRVATFPVQYPMNDIINTKMERGGSYIIQISYQPIDGSGLFVNVVDYWENIYIEHEI